MPGPLRVPVWGSVSQASLGPPFWPLLLEWAEGVGTRTQNRYQLHQHCYRCPPPVMWLALLELRGRRSEIRRQTVCLSSSVFGFIGQLLLKIKEHFFQRIFFWTNSFHPSATSETLKSWSIHLQSVISVDVRPPSTMSPVSSRPLSLCVTATCLCILFSHI